ncbi:MAG: pyridoxamine 5'-phosphate oxidase family protein [Gammaproteobacteria bacterium]|nr:pyridoxamine 5'-phosphate oxidase family protein [Gammaproteobacteria bacterium]MBU1492327.1 pyridoxamine 5'-phosphate oxidase family protein [Gammaproteobacteria bacterium]MBU2066332.1 pyridoxamine 5'-phosphate oxidase family protein [Gammaproteobacteria bacterium]MBU2139770.1 pyridoxamine 5'-phosphate oxidase family protein [Gammaproteobacteria bacterium]MBU2218630.1 pyridoxamine 5'-phosphate oxidase family protein [Gammaproteobacteria bacterium]
MTTITTLDELQALYGESHERSRRKELPRLIEPYRALIAASPFAVLASVGRDGLDCSPRGDAPGFVQILDDQTLLLPDRPGNNRIDSLRNIVEYPQVALLFLIPGVGESLRVNGRAEISLDPALLELGRAQGKLPRSVLRIHIHSCYFQCAKSVLRSGLWDAARQVERASLPSAGEIFRCIDENFDVETYERDMQHRQRTSLY